MRWTSVIWSRGVKENRQGNYENGENGLFGVSDYWKFHSCVDGPEKRIGLSLCLEIQIIGSMNILVGKRSKCVSIRFNC